MTRARCIDCIFHHIHSTRSAITSPPPGFTPEFALRLLRFPCNPPSHGRAYHSSPPPLRVASVHSSSLAATTKHYLESGLPSCFQFGRPPIHHAQCIRRCQECASFGSLPAEPRKGGERITPPFTFSFQRGFRILLRMPPMNRTSRHWRATRAAMLSRHTYEVASTAVGMKGNVRVRIQDTSSLAPPLRCHEPSDSN